MNTNSNTEKQDVQEKAGTRRGRLLYSILLVLLFVGLVPLVVSGYWQIKENEETLKITWEEFQLSIANSLAEEIQLYLDRNSQEVALMAESFALSASSIGFDRTLDKIRRTDFLGEHLGEDLLLLQVTDNEGKGAFKSKLTEVEPEIEEEIKKAFELARGGESYFGNPLIMESGVPAVVLAYPININGDTRGVFFGVVNLNPVWEKMERRNLAIFTAYAVDGSGNLFAHSERSKIKQTFNFRENPLVTEFMEAGRLTSGTKEFPIVEDGEVVNVLGAFAALPEQDWGIFIQLRSKNAYQMVDDMKRSTLIATIIAAILAVVAGMIFAHRISKPLRQLVESTKSVARGDFSRRAKVKAANEVGELADTFNTMAEEIETYVKKLRKASEVNRELFESSIKSITAAVDAKDPYTKGHSERVTDYSVAIAKSLGLPEDELKRIRYAAMLHDVGKIGIEDRVLGKPGALTREEFEIMKQHPEKGAQIMAPIDALKDVIPGLRYHHERYGGGGYPTGISGDEIPLMARIISVADTFDAMTTNRPYQKAMTPEFAIAKIYELKKTKYDEKIVEAFIKAYRRNEIKLKN